MATHDICGILRRELTARGIPASTIAALAGISSSRLSKYLNGSERCPIDHEVALYEAWSNLRKLLEYAAPLPLDYSKTNQIRECIDKMNDGTLRIIVFRPDETEAESANQ